MRGAVRLMALAGVVVLGAGTLVPAAAAEDGIGLVDTSQARWHLRHDGGVNSFTFGNPSDLPIIGDWDGDGDQTPGLYRQSDGFFYARNSNDTGIANFECFAGDPEDIPLAGDWDGDGDDTLGIYRPSLQRFFLFNKQCDNTPMGSAAVDFGFGDPGDKPVAGDWDGDGIDEVGLHRESTGLFYWRNSNSTGVADGAIIFGDPGDRFVAGEWNGLPGRDTPGLFRPSDLTFYFRHNLLPGNADETFTWTGAGAGWLPVGGDFGALPLLDGPAGFALFRELWQAGDFDGMRAVAAPAAITEARSWGHIDDMLLLDEACLTGSAGGCETLVLHPSGGFALIFTVVYEVTPGGFRIVDLIFGGDAG